MTYNCDDNSIFDLQQSKKDTEFIIKNADLEIDVAADILSTCEGIPYVGSLIKLGKVANNYFTYRFFCKLGHFLKNANDIPEGEKIKFLDSISEDDKKHISDYLTQLLNSADENGKADLMGKIYKMWLMGHFDKDMMLRLCSIVIRSYLQDLMCLKDYLEVSEVNTYVTDDLVALGVLADQGNVHEEKGEDVESVSFGATKHKLNDVGLALYKVINDNF